MALATIDHWQDPIAGLREMRRVARRVVVFTCDAGDADLFWLNRDYLPEFAGLWAGRPSLTELVGAIGARTEPVLVPCDCADGFYHACWRRPEAYLDEHVRRGMSIWARVGPDAEQRAGCQNFGDFGDRGLRRYCHRQGVSASAHGRVMACSSRF
jgi:hypothetical protein